MSAPPQIKDSRDSRHFADGSDDDNIRLCDLSHEKKEGVSFLNYIFECQ